nr:MAG TPA: hypothetical protein [Caudoviricetes sp.]DAY38178.1 MAG TPA: hypothetical protein [Caudoviricetes sp.]
MDRGVRIMGILTNAKFLETILMLFSLYIMYQMRKR